MTGVSAGSVTITAQFPTLEAWSGTLCPPATCPTWAPSASAGENVIAPYPINFTQAGSSSGGGVLQFFYEWGSSTRNTGDLVNCRLGEFVTYTGYVQGQQNTYLWPSPPWVSTSSPNPTSSFPVPGNASTCGAGWTAPCLEDQHLHGTFGTPYADANFTANQSYQYKCPGVNNGNPVDLVTGISIVRSVTHSGSTYTYKITKSGASASILHQAAPEENGRVSFSLEAPIQASSLCGAVPPAKQEIVQVGIATGVC